MEFRVIAIVLSLAEPVLQLSAMYRKGRINSASAAIAPLLLVFIANLVPICFIRRFGLLAALNWRLADYIVWLSDDLFPPGIVHPAVVFFP